MEVNMNTLLAAGLLLLFAMPGELYRIPPHEEVARMARFVANQCNWASMATISTHEPVQGQPFSNAFSTSDGPVGSGTGVPYMYLTTMEISVQDLMVNPQASLSMSLAQTDFCKNQGYDPQDPLCAHIIFSGSVLEINGTEATFAKKALFSRHPEMVDWPTDHNWFFAKMNITKVWVLDYFGGVKTVTPEDYFKATPYKATPYKATPYKATPYKATPYKATPYKATPLRGHHSQFDAEESYVFRRDLEGRG